MKFDFVVKLLLLVIAVSLSAIVVHLYVAPPAVEAQSGSAHSLYFEPARSPCALQRPAALYSAKSQSICATAISGAFRLFRPTPIRA